MSARATRYARPGATDALLLAAIALTASAVGTAAYQQFEWDGVSALAAGFAAFVALVLLQAVLGGGRSRRLQNNELERLTVEIARAKGELRPPSRPGRRAVEQATAPEGRATAPTTRGGAPSFGVAEPAAGPATARGGPQRREADALPASAAGASGVAEGTAGRPLAPQDQGADAPAVRSQSPRSSFFDFWSIRPSAQRAEPRPVRGRPSREHQLQADPSLRISGGHPVRAASGRAAAGAEPSVVSEADVEILQAAIRRLANEMETVDVQVRAAKPAAGAAPPAPPPAVRTPPEIAIDISVDGLHVASQAMRQSSRQSSQQAPQRRAAPPPLPARPAATETPVPTPERRVEPHAAQPTGAAPRNGPPPVGANHARIAAVAAAITAGRFDVLLEPILGLEDQHARHYEVSLRLHGLGGGAADLTGLGGSGLLALFDSARIARSADMALQLADRGKQGKVFSRYEAESLGDSRFLAGIADVGRRREGLPRLLVLSFAQSAVRHFAGAQWAAIADMHALGFRFALSAVTDLDMDFEFLSAAGFDFVKLDADVFLEGMPAPGGVIPAGDICRHLKRLGLTTVVEHIDDPEKLERLFGLGVLYGQGKLFGGARPVRADALSSDAA